MIDTDLEGILWHLGPYWLCSALFLGWISRGTHLPVVADAVGLLVVREALRASLAGLFGRRDQKFKVTAKGARRDAVVVQWGLVGPFLALVLATLGGIAWRVAQGPIPGVTPGLEAMNLFWSFYNCLALLIACLICTEQPRHRAEERFDADEPALLRHAGAARPERVRLRDLSIRGARVEPEAAGARAAPGDLVALSVPAVGEVPAEIRRVTPAGLHLAFRPAPAQQAALIRKVFSGSYVRPVLQTSPLALMRVLLRRALG